MEKNVERTVWEAKRYYERWDIMAFSRKKVNTALR